MIASVLGTRAARSTAAWVKHFSTSSVCQALVSVSHEQLGSHNVGIVSLNRLPANGLNLSLCAELTETLKGLRTSGNTHGIILTSSAPKVFSSGLDFNELYQTPREHIELLWRQFQDMWLELYSTNLTTLAEINGHCIAGGLILSAACDYRIAVEGSYGIGAPAAKVGLIIPPWVLKMLTYLMGQRRTELALPRGTVFTPDEALTVGLVDEVHSSGDLRNASFAALKPYLDVCHETRAWMKYFLRADLIEKFTETRDKDMEQFVSYVLRDSVQGRLKSYMDQMNIKTK